MAKFDNRIQAGRELARLLKSYSQRSNVLVLGLPRGGVPVAFEIAQVLRVPMDIFIVRKLGVPGQEELAMGAIATGGTRVLNPRVIAELGIPQQVVDEVTQREEGELQRRERAYRDDRPLPRINRKTIILVDDGLATGASMYAAVLALKGQNPLRLIVAVPVAAPETCDSFTKIVDEIVCASTPEPFYGVGAWYEDFSQVSDEQVREYLQASIHQGEPK
jgi:predicted phosphoribosyltransferase